MITLSKTYSGKRVIQNRLGYWMHKRRVKISDLIERCIDANATAISLMENDRALPTRTDLKIIADTLKVAPSDIWSRERLDLLGLLKDEKAVSGHEGEVRFRVWMLPEEKEKLEQAIERLGYKTPTAWFRQMAAMTLDKAEKEGLR